MCWEECDKCSFPIPELQLDCGHLLHNAPWLALPFIIFPPLKQFSFMEDNRSSSACREWVKKRLPNCEHEAILPCSEDVREFRCPSICGEFMGCCQRTCKRRCADCQEVSSTAGTRDAHTTHFCGRILHCQHPCKEVCGQDHNRLCGYNDCPEPCRQSCSHHQCERGCSKPCTPCAMACPWVCEHWACPVPCGSVRIHLFITDT
jgi:hypothetical protein